MIYLFALVCTFSDTEAATEVTVDGLRQSFNFHKWKQQPRVSYMPPHVCQVELLRQILHREVECIGSGPRRNVLTTRVIAVETRYTLGHHASTRMQNVTTVAKWGGHLRRCAAVRSSIQGPIAATSNTQGQWSIWRKKHRPWRRKSTACSSWRLNSTIRLLWSWRWLKDTRSVWKLTLALLSRWSRETFISESGEASLSWNKQSASVHTLVSR